MREKKNAKGKLKKISRISGQMFGLLIFVRAVLPLVVYSVLPVIPSASHWIQHFVIYLSLQYRQIDIVGCFLVSDVASNFYVMAFICYKYKRMRAGRLCYRLAKLHKTFFTILAMGHCVVWAIRVWVWVSKGRALPMVNIYTLSTLVLIGQESWSASLRSKLKSGLEEAQGTAAGSGLC